MPTSGNSSSSLDVPSTPEAEAGPARAPQVDEAIPSEGYQRLPIAGLGGSAGSIQALQRLFSSMPPTTGFAFVVVLHLSPEHESTLPDLLARWTSMRVVTASDGVLLERDTVYVIPPGKHLATADGQLRLTKLEPQKGRRVAVDLFFRTLADTHGPHAAAVVLSGADGDGAIGIKRVKERGGLTIAQDPDEADQPNMPRSAIATGMVDWVLPVSAIAERLIKYFEIERRLQLPPVDGPPPGTAPPPLVDPREAALHEVLMFLRMRTGRDFSYYKRGTVLRRIGRRMQVNGVEDLSAYLSFLRGHTGEAPALLQDLLISVTNFFRDPVAFEALKKHLPRLFEGMTGSEPFRIWVPACATGEEAYSLAILLLEHADRSGIRPLFQIFACDLDENAIRAARAGLYPDTIVADVSEERLRRFFSKEMVGYRVRREVRELILFATHDLVKDVPFSRMDLVSCRNLLIYLDRKAQERVIDVCHFALRKEGILFLGSSESIDETNQFFVPLDPKHRIYLHASAGRAELGMLMSEGSLALRTTSEEAPVVAGRAFLPINPGDQSLGSRSMALPERGALAETHFKVLERFAPPSVIVNHDFDIIHVSENAARFLRFMAGTPTSHLFRVVHPMLRLELRAALLRAGETKGTARAHRVPLVIDQESFEVEIRVAPTTEFAPGCFLVSFDASKTDSSQPSDAKKPASEASQILESEVDHLREELRHMSEHSEASEEELKAGNEELQAMNEELRSATEELEAGREELQSLNEELSTVNHELKDKVGELSQANSDLHNLMASTAIPTVFLDRDLRIMRYTPSAVALFNFIPSDVGRPSAHIKSQLDYRDLQSDAAKVLRELQPIEREVDGVDHRTFLVRLLPYQTPEDQIEGVVLTFVDITEQKRIREALAASQERFRLVLENAREFAIIGLNNDRQIATWNIGAQQIFGWEAAEAIGRDVDLIFCEEDRNTELPVWEIQTALAQGRAEDERWHCRKDGSRFWGSGVTMVMRNQAGQTVGFVKILRDETAAREATQEVLKSRTDLQAALAETQRAREEAENANRSKDRFLAMLSHELRTPLTPSLMIAEDILETGDVPPRIAEGLKEILSNIDLETHLIDDLLDLTRIGRGKFEIDIASMDVHEAIRAGVDITKPEIERNKQELRLELHATETRLSGDFRRLQQVFWNLLKNAAKFTSEHGLIRIQSRNESGTIIIMVCDDGCGITTHALPFIFEAFRQADEGIARRYGGLGLGLAISKATVEAHGGTIEAASPGLGKGATFTVRLPLT